MYEKQKQMLEDLTAMIAELERVLKRENDENVESLQRAIGRSDTDAICMWSRYITYTDNESRKLKRAHAVLERLINQNII